MGDDRHEKVLRRYDQLIRRLRRAADTLQIVGDFESAGRRLPIAVVRMGSGPRRVMIAAGIHGDEPAGVEAAARFIETARDDAALLSRFSFTIFPCNNPTGFELGTRENANGVDLNREFAARRPQPEVEIITGALEGLCFDLVFEMHEDVDSPGLYLYELVDNAKDHLGERIVGAAERVGCPINTSRRIEGMSARDGIIRRNVIRFRKTRLPQAIYTYRTCGGHVITLEPPASVLSFEQRVQVELAALDVALSSLS